MKLYFMRHGIANRSQWGGVDELRPLTEKGCQAVKEIARFLYNRDIRFNAILSSPLTRAMQTAQLVAEVYDLEDHLIEDKRLSPGFGLEELREIIKNNDEDKELLLVGHEPDLSLVIGRLIGNGRIIMKKGSVACVDLAFQPSITGELLWLATPALMGTKR